jgi:D-sedoheptulose 7-phosphate isomerase
MDTTIRDRLEGAMKAIGSLIELEDDLREVIEAVVTCVDRGGTIYTCGNGGSATQASHLAEELVGRYRSDRPAIPAVCLNADPAAITCIANDFGFDQIFARPCQALLSEGDALIAFSTSGESPNIVQGLTAARSKGATTIGVLGRNGGAARDCCDRSITVPHDDSAFIQDAHQVILHLVCEVLETRAAAVG